MQAVDQVSDQALIDAFAAEVELRKSRKRAQPVAGIKATDPGSIAVSIFDVAASGTDRTFIYAAPESGGNSHVAAPEAQAHQPAEEPDPDKAYCVVKVMERRQEMLQHTVTPSEWTIREFERINKLNLDAREVDIKKPAKSAKDSGADASDRKTR